MSESVSIRCPVCGAFLAKVDRVDVKSIDDAKVSFMLETVCPNRRCGRKDRRIVDAFLPKGPTGGVLRK